MITMANTIVYNFGREVMDLEMHMELKWDCTIIPVVVNGTRPLEEKMKLGWNNMLKIRMEMY